MLAIKPTRPVQWNTNHERLTGVQQLYRDIIDKISVRVDQETRTLTHTMRKQPRVDAKLKSKANSNKCDDQWLSMV